MRNPHRPASRRRRTPIAAALAILVAAGGLSLAARAEAAVSCRVDYAVTSQWATGFTAGVTITNLGDPVAGWRLTWSFSAGQQVTQSWNGSFTQSGGQVTVANADWNGNLATGAATTFGFNATSGATNPSPAAFSLNGVACTGAAQPTTTGPPTTTVPPTSTSTPTSTTLPPPPPAQGRQMEDLDRGLVSVRSGTGNYVGWRLLGTDPPNVAFNLYRGSTRVNASPITGSTNLLDGGAPAGASYTVRAVVDGVEQAPSEPSLNLAGNFLDVRLQVPAGGTTPDGVSYTYSANDASVGDLDGDGRYEIVLKWDPSNSKDNSQAGYTGNVFVDAYRLDGTRLWRVDLGRNIRAGAHYTQFQVYDYDGDGRAEVAMKTADGTRDGTGAVIGSAAADHRNTSGYVLAGSEFLTMFDGRTGAAMSTVPYEPPRGTVSAWGDSYGNRVDRFLAATAYLDGQRPSLIMARGYYTRTVLAAWDFRAGALTRRWTFDSNVAGSRFTGQGNHNLSVADVDGDGRDEILYGSMAVDDNGAGMYTGYGHGDAMHVGDLVPSRPGQEVWTIHEASDVPGADLHDARTGAVLFSKANTTGGEGPGRGVAADVFAGNPGAEFWGAGAGLSGLFGASGATVGRQPSSANFVAWWDADPVRELVDQTRIDKYGTGGETRLLTGSGVAASNGTKATPALSGDLFGDWREEVAWRTGDSGALRIYTTTAVTGIRVHTLMHDPQYRVAIAWQNTAYNQPPHPSFFLGDGMAAPPRPAIYVR